MMIAVGAVILAAGEGARFGGPKGLARLGDQTWLSLAVQGLRAAGIEWITVVLGARAPEVRSRSGVPSTSSAGGDETGQAHVSWIVNDRWEKGRAGSIACGLADLPLGCSGALLHSVDFPRVQVSTFRALAEAFRTDAGGRSSILVPVEGSKRGHPILVGRDVWPEIQALAPDEPLHLVVRRDPARVREIEVRDPGIHRNINTMAESEET